MKVDCHGTGTQIETLPVGKGSLFAKLVSELKLLVDGATFKNIIVSIVTGLNLFWIIRGFLQILARVRPEDSVIAEQYETIKKKRSHYLRKLCKIPFNLAPK